MDDFFFLQQLPDFPCRVAGSGDVLPPQLGIAFGHLDVRMAEDLRQFVKKGFSSANIAVTCRLVRPCRGPQRQVFVVGVDECACQPSVLPSDPDTPAPLPGSRTFCPSVASSAHGRRPTRPCPCDPDRAPYKEMPSRRSAPEHRDTEDSSVDRRCRATVRLRASCPKPRPASIRPAAERLFMQFGPHP